MISRYQKHRYGPSLERFALLCFEYDLFILDKNELKLRDLCQWSPTDEQRTLAFPNYTFLDENKNLLRKLSLYIVRKGEEKTFLSFVTWREKKKQRSNQTVKLHFSFVNFATLTLKFLTRLLSSKHVISIIQDIDEAL